MNAKFRALFMNAAVVATMMGFAVPAHAQNLSAGTRLRVTTDDARSVGRVERSTADSFTLTLSSGGQVAYSWEDIERVQRSLGSRGRPGRGALIGAGVATALTLGSVVFDSGENEVEDELADMIMVLVLPVTAAIGAGVGALAGLAWRSERWDTLPITSVSAGRQLRPELAVVIEF